MEVWRRGVAMAQQQSVDVAHQIVHKDGCKFCFFLTSL